jgi:hypothetical protein
MKQCQGPWRRERGLHDERRQFLLAVGQEKIATSNVDLGSAGTGFASGEKVKS